MYLVSSKELIEADIESIYLQQELTKRGYNSKIVCWDDPQINWSDASLSISRTTGTYFTNPPKFLDWTRNVEETTTLWNPNKIIEWNIHKRYLLELQKHGIPMPETYLIPQNTPKTIDEILEQIPWGTFIIKPSIGAGSGGIRRFTKDSPDFHSIANYVFTRARSERRPEC